MQFLIQDDLFLKRKENKTIPILTTAKDSSNDFKSSTIKGGITSRSLFLANFTNYFKWCICSYRSHIPSFRTFEDSMMQLRQLLHSPFSSEIQQGMKKNRVSFAAFEAPQILHHTCDFVLLWKCILFNALFIRMNCACVA